MQTSAHPPTETAKVRAAFAERLRFHLLNLPLPAARDSDRNALIRQAIKAGERRFTGAAPTGFGGLL